LSKIYLNQSPLLTFVGGKETSFSNRYVLFYEKNSISPTKRRKYDKLQANANIKLLEKLQQIGPNIGLNRVNNRQLGCVLHKRLDITCIIDVSHFVRTTGKWFPIEITNIASTVCLRGESECDFKRNPELGELDIV